MRKAAPIPTILLPALLMVLAGCAQLPERSSEPPPTLAAEQYPGAFHAAVEVLTELGFEPDRVDARAGVITTQPEASAGLLTPWIPVESTSGQELEGALHRERRSVRVRFGPVTDTSLPPAPPGSQVDAAVPAPPVASLAGPLALTVTVYVDRVQRTGEQLDPTSVRLTNYSEDRLLTRRGMWPVYSVSRERDPRLEERIAQRITDRIKNSNG